MNIFSLSKKEIMRSELAEACAKVDELSNKLNPTERKERTDKGKKRVKYDSSLPPKYRQYLGRANKKQIPFELSVNEFESLLKQSCIYCGTNSKIGIDRLDSSLGYTIDNSRPCCGQCNIMKYTTSQEDFIQHIKKIYNYLHNR